MIVSSRASRAHLLLPLLIIRSIIKNHAEEGDREETGRRRMRRRMNYSLNLQPSDNRQQ